MFTEKEETMKQPFKFNLQLFGNGDPEPTPTPEPTPDPTPEPNPQPEEGLPKTKEELEKFLQSEADKRVTGALKTAQAKWEADFKAKLEVEKKEADRLAKLSAAEKEKALMERQKNELSQKEREIALREMKLESMKILSDTMVLNNHKAIEYAIDFIDDLTTDNAEETKTKIDKWLNMFNKAVGDGVNDALKSSSIKPQAGAVATGLNTKLEEARKKAIATGKHEDRVAYAQIKHEIELSKK